MRVRILTAMNSPRRRFSPIGLAEEFDEDVSIVAYHFRELVAFGFLEVVEENKVRGSVEHIHRATTRAMAWEREWAQIPPTFKAHIAALTTRLGFEALGAAIDDGAFAARDDGVVAQDTLRLDERGAAAAMEVLNQAVASLIEIDREATTRLEESGEEGLLISYMAIGYEGSLRPL
jgi:hypothetical protein